MFRALPAAFAALILLNCAGVEAEEQELPPRTPALELTGRVVDAAELFDAQYEDGLTRKLGQLEQNTQVQLVVVTTPDLKGQDIADYSVELGRAWGLGSAERDDGLLLLVAPNERMVRIEVGYGLEASVKDEEAAQIIQDDILPHFRNGYFEVGVAEGVDSLIREVTPIELKEAA